jgi:toxin CptA
MPSVQQLLDSLAGASFEGLPTGAVVTCSVGLVECRSGERLSAAIARSDVALYRAKDGGRNQVVCSCSCAARFRR